MMEILLKEIAYARSGDKGSNANVGVIAYTSEGYQFLKETLTEETVGNFFMPLGWQAIHRYELPNLEALNFVLEGVLAGGGSRSLRIDSQGKTLGQAILMMPLEIPSEKLSFMLQTKGKKDG